MKKLLLSLAIAGSSFASIAQLSTLTVGSTAPNFTVTDLHGHSHTLSEYSGKYVVVDFFAYWCGPCAAIAPTINDFYKKYGCNAYDVVVLAIEYEGTIAQTQAFEDANGGDANFPTPTVAGQNTGAAVHAAYSPAAFPTIILIGPDGLIKNTDIWPISSVATLETAVTNAGGSSALVVHNCSLASVEEVSVLESATIYPNPSNLNASISLSSLVNGTMNAEVIDVNGKVISSVSQNVTEGENSISLHTEGIENGTYIVKITLNGTEKRISFVKM
ncbi:MAG: redoxin domain-containing protein [Fluviicola sp.]|jgi:thiol-disulfide isomerase/thioredoxin